MSFVFRIYRQLAKAFPHEFKLAYGAGVLQLGDDIVEHIASRHGSLGLIPLLADIAIRVPIEYLSEMQRDMRYAVRALIKSPGFALVGIISMGVGIGLTTVVYNSKWQFIYRDLPAAANAKRLVMAQRPVSYYYIEQYRSQQNLFSGVAALKLGVPFNVTLSNDSSAKPQRIFGQLVSPDYFSVLGVPAERGRVLSPDFEKPGGAPVVVISDRFWRNQLSASPDAVGQTIRLNGESVTIVGITPPHFHGAVAISPAELFVPVTAPAAVAPELAGNVLHQRNAKEFMALMYLAPGVSLQSAESALDVMTRHLDEQDASAPKAFDKTRRVTLLKAGTMIPLPPNLKSVVMGFFLVVMGLIMTIACMNLANMLLARGANRRKELAIRLSVGASRFRLVRQMMSEGIVLSLLGGAAGFALAYFISILNSHFMPPSPLPVETAAPPDWHVAIFVFVLAVVCGIGFSLIPALRATKADVTPALKEGPALQLPGYRRFGLRNLLMVAQITGSLMLLLITGFLVMGLSKASNFHTKFNPDTMYLLSIDPVRDGYSSAKAEALFEKLPEHLRSASAVTTVTLAGQAPFSIEDDEDAAVQVSTGDSQGNSRIQISANEESVGAGYFAALSEPMLAGRDFVQMDQRTPDDGSKALPVIVNESAAHSLFKNGNLIGGHLRDERQSYEVVGVVHDLKGGIGLSRSVIYLPLTQRNFLTPPADGMTIMVRSDAGPDALSEIRREIAFLDPKLNLFNVRTLREELERSRSSERFAVNTYGGIGLFGLVLASIGLAGVTAYAVAQRRKEIGIRMALGARKNQVLLLVLREGMALVTIGSVLGFLGAFALAKLLSSLTDIFVQSLNIGTTDLRLLVGAPLLLGGLALLACYVPARRAVKIDPLKALREG